MLKRFFLIFFSSLCLHPFAQKTFPVNGVATEFEPIYAFINAYIIDAENEIENGIMIKPIRNIKMKFREFCYIYPL